MTQKSRTGQGLETTPVRPAASQPDGRMGGSTPHTNHPAGWYRTMDRGFAVGHFGFPALPRRGERHTATDGSVWEFALTGTDWWELAEHAPTSPTMELLAAALKREGDWESKLQHSERGYWLPIAERLLADTELLDAVVAYHRPALPEVEVGQLYQHPSEDAADFRIVRRLRNFGLGQVGMLPSPLPVVGRVWVAVVDFPLAGDTEILCTAEGLASRGYTLTDITEEPTA